MLEPENFCGGDAPPRSPVARVSSLGGPPTGAHHVLLGAASILVMAFGIAVVSAPLAGAGDNHNPGVESPTDGAFVSTRAFDVVVRASEGSRVAVNGADAIRSEGLYLAHVSVASEGPQALVVVVEGKEGPPVVLRRTVTVDSIAPVIAVDDLVDGAIAVGPASTRRIVRGTVIDSNPARLRLGSESVDLGVDGRFSVTVDTTAVAADIALVATDRAGNESALLRVPLHRSPTPTTVPALLLGATDRVLEDDWEAVSILISRARSLGVDAHDVPLALRARLDAFEAAPVLEILEPRDGDMVHELSFRVRGKLTTNRATDRVLMNGRELRSGPGVFDLTVPIEANATLPLSFVVQHRDQVRLAAGTRSIQHRYEVFHSFLDGWAIPEGPGRDDGTGYPLRIRRLRDDMVMILVPVGAPKAATGGETAHPPGRPFYMDEHEVTWEMWMRAKPAIQDGLGLYFKGHEQNRFFFNVSSGGAPMVRMTWDEIQPYLKWANVELPTERQWELAAGTGETVEDVACNEWGEQDGFEKLAPVKSFPPNARGFYDMAGNAMEWTADRMHLPDSEPSADHDTAVHVIRGSSWIDVSQRSEGVRRRVGGAPWLRSALVGFRCAKSLP